MHRFKKRNLALLIAAACNTTLASETQTLQDVVVTATRSATEIDSVAATVTSINRTVLDRRLPADEADLFKEETDVSFARDLRRHGATRINIRGLEDNRVVQMVDGVRLADYYNGGGPANYTLSTSPTVMSDFLKRVEIIRGATSSLYGSDAIGGVVGFVTLDPADLLQAGETSGFRYRASYNGANTSTGQTLLGALRSEGAELLLGYSQARGHEFDNQGTVNTLSPSRTTPNPLTVDDRGALAKLIVRPATGHKLSATFEGRSQSGESDIRRFSTALPRVTAMNGDDNVRRLRGSVEWEHTPAQAGVYDRMTARLYHQDSETRNYNTQQRTKTTTGCSATMSGTNNCYVETDFKVDQKNTGINLQLEKMLKSGDVSHLLTYGLDASRVHVEEMRDGRIWNKTTGKFTKTLAGEVFPLRDFANGATDTLGLFILDEISGLAGDRLSLLPGLRYDRTRLKPEVDSLAQNVLTQIGRTAVEQTHGAFSPKLGAIWRFDPVLSAYGQIARGFRAPSYNEVNAMFRNTSQGYGTTPNPDLSPETSVGVELGLRLNTGNLRSQFSAFDNRYKDFIESVRFSCPGNPNCISGTTATYQSVSLNRVRIYGAELRTTWDFSPGWSTSASLAYAHGTNEETGQALNSVEPTRIFASIARDFGSWGGESRIRAAGRKSRVDDTSGSWFRTPGYAVTDFSMWWKLDRKAQITVALNNAFDKKYWLWSDIRQADASNPVGADFYSQPGRNFSIAFQSEF